MIETGLAPTPYAAEATAVHVAQAPLSSAEVALGITSTSTATSSFTEVKQQLDDSCGDVNAAATTNTGCNASSSSVDGSTVTGSSLSRTNSIWGMTSYPSSPIDMPKRLHISNIPFRFRDLDLKAMFGVNIYNLSEDFSCNLEPPVSTSSSLLCYILSLVSSEPVHLRMFMHILIDIVSFLRSNSGPSSTWKSSSMSADPR